MFKKLIIFWLGLFTSISVYSQDSYTAIADGSWSSASTWSCSGTCGGSGIPTSSDDVTIGSGFNVTVSGLQSCRNILVHENTENALVINGRSSLTITGVLTTTFNPPDRSIVSGVGRLIFTAENLNDDLGLGFNDLVIAYWSSDSPLPRCDFDLSNAARIAYIYTSDFSSTDDIIFGNGMLLSGSTLTINSGNDIGGLQIPSGNLTINSSGYLYTTVPITGDGTNNSSINQLELNGTLELGSANTFINSSTCNINDNSVLLIFFSNSTNQTEGWWYQSNFPTSLSVSSNSTISYSANANQNVYAYNYGNLTVSSSTTTTKTLTTGNLVVNGALTIDGLNTTFNTGTNSVTLNGNLENNGIWTPGGNVAFESGGSQSINGTQVIQFANFRVGNNSTVTLSNINLDVNGLLDIDPGSTFDQFNENANISGNMTIDGIFDGNAGLTIFDGTTSFTGVGSGTRDFNDVQIASGATLTAPSNGTFNVSGDFENDGAFNHNNGTVFFNGTLETQNIAANSSSSTTFSSVIVGYDANVEGNVSMLRYLTFDDSDGSVTFDADGSGSGSFTLLSSAAGTAGIGTIPGGSSVIGNVNFERYFDNQNEWVHFAFPINGQTIETLQQDISITGDFTGSTPGLPAVASFYYYDETETGDVDQGWVEYPSPGSDNGDPISTTRGYVAWLTDGSENSQEINISGTINQGNQNLNITYNSNFGANDDGWNLVVNPYPSAIDWFSSDWIRDIDDTGTDGDPAELNAQAAIWDGPSNIYVYSGTPQWNDGIIAPGQAFWVQTINPISDGLIATEGVKVTNYSTEFFREAVPDQDNMLVVKLTDNNESADRAYLYFDEKATDSFDSKYDFRKLKNDIFNISSYFTEGEYLAINKMSAKECSKKIKLNITDISEGDYVLNFSNLSQFTFSSNVKLIDNFTSEEINVSEGENYEFSVTSDPNSFGNARFEVEFDFSNQSTPEISVDQNTLTSNLIDGNQWYRNGEILSNDTLRNLEVEETGVYHLVSTPFGCGNEYKSLDVVAYISDEDLQYSGCDQVIALNTGNLYPGTYEMNVANLIGLNNRTGAYLVDSYLDEEIDLSSENNYSFIVSEEPGSFGSGRFEVVLRNEFAPEITVENNTLVSNINTANQWLHNGTPIEGETDIQTELNTTGIYHLTSSPNGCERKSSNFVAFISDEDKSLEECEKTIPLNVGNPSIGDFQLLFNNFDDFDDDLGIYIVDNFNSDTIDFANLEEYGFTVTNNSESYGERFEIILTKNFTPNIIADGNLLISNFEFGNQWYKDGELIEGATNPTLDAQEKGEYYVEVTQTGCSYTSNRITVVVDITGLEKIDGEDLLIYPNPVQNSINLSIPNEFSNRAIIEVYDFSGKKLYKNKLKGLHGKFKFDATFLNKGTYHLVISNDMYYYQSKFVKE